MPKEIPLHLEQADSDENPKPQVTDEIQANLTKYCNEKIQQLHESLENPYCGNSLKEFYKDKSPEEYYTGEKNGTIETLSRVPLEAQEILLRKPDNMTQEEYGNELSWIAKDISCGLIIAEENATGEGYSFTSMQPNVVDHGDHEIFKSRNHRLLLHNAFRMPPEQREIYMANKNEWLISVHHLNSSKQQ